MSKTSLFHPIAIVGMALRFPSAPNDHNDDGLKAGNGEKSFTRLLGGQSNAFRQIPEERWSIEGGAKSPHGIYTQTGAFLDGIAQFDAEAFGLSEGESEALDPQQRMLLELSWLALGNAGISQKLAQKIATGVFVGSTFEDYRLIAGDLGGGLPQSSSRFLGLLRSAMAGRISYALNLRGPAMFMDASCATGLLAVYQACKSLSSGDCGLALAGAANLLLHPDSWSGLCMSGALSPSGQSRPFDDAADGYVRGEGAAIFALMPLEEAQKRGLNIRGIIRGGAVNHDGKSNGLTAPNGSAQEEVIRQALASSGFGPERIGVVETHGTGTRLGDPIEAMALGRVFSAPLKGKHQIALMSVKALVGHLESAAGCAGLARLVLDSERGALAAQPAREKPNSLIPWERLPFTTLREESAWPQDKHGPLCAGLSAFGMSGTNVHLIFEPGPRQKEAAALRPDPLADRLIPFSAHNMAALGEMAEALEAAAGQTSPQILARAAQVADSGLACRSALLGGSAQGGFERLESKRSGGGAPATAWMFTGQGAQYFGMGQRLYQASGLFRSVIDTCAELARPVLNLNLAEFITAQNDQPMLDTAIVQPALFALQAGLTALWKQYLPAPEFMIGHSIGEIALAHALGVLSLKDGILLAAQRGKLTAELCKAPGAMLAAALPAAQLEGFLAEATGNVVIASYNGPAQTVFAGDEASILKIRENLKGAGVKCSRLSVSHAFHSPLMQPMLEAFGEVLGKIAFNKLEDTETLFASTVTGEFEPAKLLCEPGYWLRHLLSPVRFEQAARLLLEERPDILLEVGPGPVLGGLIGQLAGEGALPAILSSLLPGFDDLESLAGTLGGMYIEGLEIAWPETPPALAARHMPPYPFQGRAYWWPSPALNAPVENSGLRLGRPESGNEAAGQAADTAGPACTAGTLRAIWEKWLPVKGFEADADFFTLGGNSLIAAQIVLDIRKKLRPDFSMAAFLKNTSLNRLETALGSAAPCGQEVWSGLPAIIANPAERYSPFPLNDMQHAYWIGRRNYFDTGEVGIHVYFEVDREKLDVERFRRAWHKLVQRHDMLHCVVQSNGEQTVLREIPAYSIPCEDISALDQAGQQERILKTRAELEHKLFDLSVWPQFDVRIHQLSGGLSRIHFAIDGWCVDGWSYQILFNDLNSLYNEPELELPELPFTFRDYVLATLELEKSPAWENDRSYWLERLATLPQAPALPLRAVRAPGSAKPVFTRRECRFEAEKWLAIKEQAGRAGISTASVILSVYADTLGLWAAEPHFCINVPRFNRLPMHADVDKVIGEFASFTLLEVERRAGQNFLGFARETQEQMWRDLDHSLFSGVKVLRELAQVRSVPKSGAMPYVFTMAPEQLQNGRVESMISAINRLGEMEYMLTETPQVWIDCQYNEDNGAVRISWDSLDDYFPEGMVEAMFASFSGALGTLAASPAAWEAEDLVRMPADQLARRELANSTARPVPAEDLFTLFARQAKAAPQAEALVSPDERLTYGELKKRVESLAAALLENGLKPGDRVAICQKKGWAQIVSVFAVLAAGGAYVPLDPKIPTARMGSIVRDAGAALILTAAGSPPVPSGPGLPAALRGDELALRDVLPPKLPRRKQSSLAYLIYTSGSTGTPKGVMISDRSVVNMLNDTNERFGIGAGERIFGVTGLHHDLSVYDVFGALCGGAALVLPGAEDERNAGAWLALVRKERVTFWNSVPAIMEMLLAVAAENGGIGDSLRLVILGGDWIPVKLPARLRAQALKAELYTIGGPTETTVWNIFHHTSEADGLKPSVPYGAPAGNAGYYIRDALGRERPDYAVGEMHCSGEGLALGYWNSPERTAQSFFDDPATGLRLYATGDLGYWEADGEIRFSGRNDGQVKIHGMRIETAEIEAVLTRNQGVDEAAVIVDETQKIVAFTTAKTAEDRWPGYFDSAMAGAVQANAAEWEEWSRFYATAELAATAAMQATLLQLCGPAPWSAEKILAAHPGARRLEKPLRQWIAQLEQDPAGPATAGEAAARRDAHLAELERLAETGPGDNCARKVLARYYHSALSAQADIVLGEADPLESLFPEGSNEVSEAIYNNIVTARCLHSGLYQALRQTVEGCAPGSLLVAEVGAGSGSTTRVVIDALGESLGRYHFTDVSPWFLEQAQERFAGVGGFSTGIFNLNAPGAEKQLGGEPLDLILGVNSVHCAADLEAALKDLFGRLKQGGHLVLLEMTRIDRQVMATTGLIDGFHTYNDFRNGQLSPLLSCAGWLELLAKAGFEAHAVLPEGCELGENIIIARRPAGEKGPDAAALLEKVKAVLPAHMVPSAIHFLESLPLTVNGKVDRKALAALSPQLTRTGVYTPVSDVESRILEICREVAPKLDIHPNISLFEAGLNSLQATKLALRLGSGFGRELPVTVVFEYPSLKALARLLSPQENTDSAADLLESARSRARKRRLRHGGANANGERVDVA